MKEKQQTNKNENYEEPAKGEIMRRTNNHEGKTQNIPSEKMLDYSRRRNRQLGYLPNKSKGHAKERGPEKPLDRGSWRHLLACGRCHRIVNQKKK